MPVTEPSLLNQLLLLLLNVLLARPLTAVTITQQV